MRMGVVMLVAYCKSSKSHIQSEALWVDKYRTGSGSDLIQRALPNNQVIHVKDCRKVEAGRYRSLFRICGHTTAV